MEEQFVPYEIALELKELGFNVLCFCGYNRNKKLYLNGHNVYTPIEGFKITANTGKIPAPLWQQAFDWCLKKIDNNNLSLIVYNDSNIYLSLCEFGQENYMYHFTNYNDLMVKLIELCRK